MKKQEKTAGEYKTNWDLTYLYKNYNDPAIQKDLLLIETSCTSFSSKYVKKDFTSSPAVLKKALDEYFSLPIEKIGHKAHFYFQLNLHLNSEDKDASIKLNKVIKQLTDSSNKLTFFILKIGNIAKDKQKAFLSAKELANYSYLLDHIFKNSRYQLSEVEENIFNNVSQTSVDMWVSLQEETLSKKEVVFKKEKIPVSKALNTYPELPKQHDRRVLASLVIEKLKENADIAEAEMNAIISHKDYLDQKRGYKKSYSATALHYEQDEKTIESLVDVVTKNFPVVHSFYKLHKEILKLDTLYYCDRSIGIGEIKKSFSFDSSVELVSKAFAQFGDEYPKILENYLAEGRIDVFPKKGKVGGAYNWSLGSTDEPRGVVLLNHNNTVRSFETLAHEMGHAIHGVLSARSQPRYYRSYTIATAEVASTFFEQMAQDYIFDLLPERDQIILLHNRIKSDVSTIFRQIALFNFEKELHVEIKKAGKVTHIQMAQMLTKHMKSYLGPAFTLTEDDGYFFVSWSHIRNFFYVYTYAFGQIVSKSLYKKWKNNNAYSKQVEKFLTSGGCDTVENIFESIGIDVTKPEFFEQGIESIKSDISLLKKLIKKQK